MMENLVFVQLTWHICVPWVVDVQDAFFDTFRQWHEVRRHGNYILWMATQRYCMSEGINHQQ